jgi:hypothetical protein
VHFDRLVSNALSLDNSLKYGEAFGTTLNDSVTDILPGYGLQASYNNARIGSTKSFRSFISRLFHYNPVPFNIQSLSKFLRDPIQVNQVEPGIALGRLPVCNPSRQAVEISRTLFRRCR